MKGTRHKKIWIVDDRSNTKTVAKCFTKSNEEKYQNIIKMEENIKASEQVIN